jgi:hypothetical protein
VELPLFTKCGAQELLDQRPCLFHSEKGLALGSSSCIPTIQIVRLIIHLKTSLGYSDVVRETARGLASLQLSIDDCMEL